MIRQGKRIISERYRVCDGHLSLARGLMFSRKRDLLFVFPKEKRVSLHMLFVFFPVWAVYVSEEKKVVALRKMLPFLSVVYPKKRAKFIIELPRDPALKLGQVLSW